MDPQYTVAQIKFSAAISSTVSAIVAGTSSMIGRNWLSVGACGGLSFGLIQGAISQVARNNGRSLMSEFEGAVIAYGLSNAAASLGFIAEPVSIPTATALTVGVVAFKIFIHRKAIENLKEVKANMKEVEANMKEVEANMKEVEANMKAVEANMKEAKANITEIEKEIA
jgi:hypothetical protein